jgi:hypothetical protein
VEITTDNPMEKDDTKVEEHKEKRHNDKEELLQYVRQKNQISASKSKNAVTIEMDSCERACCKSS